MEGRPVIQVENVAKRYRLGNYGTASLAEEAQALWSRLRGKDDLLGPVDAPSRTQRTGEVFWALREVGFEMRQGEVLGIVGRNGAGKSTLLKLLSRITKPTTGVIRMKGRTASLLEVGTGFHPDLTGRENIFLNGAILGMRKAEIAAKLDEIIAFSGIEHHIDTPVKRYSSGMKVRLGFAVAAHLEPEILIVDEVLAVGDAEFQRKCLGKMKDVSHSGRTILFVSHNMTAVRSLCSRTIWLEGGRVRMDGPTDEVVRNYLGTFNAFTDERRWDAHEAPGTAEVRLARVALQRPEPDAPLTWNDPFRILIGLRNATITDGDLNIGIHVYNGEDVLAFASSLNEFGPDTAPLGPGDHEIWCDVPGELLNTNDYRVVVNFFRKGNLLFRAEETISFTVHDGKRERAYYGKKNGVFRPRLKWGSNSGPSA